MKFKTRESVDYLAVLRKIGLCKPFKYIKKMPEIL